MINQDKWISSLPKNNEKFDENRNKIDNSRWINTIPQKNKYKNPAWKYSFLVILFVCGCYFVSAVKNETRNLEKEIENLRASNGKIKYNLEQAILDNEVVTSPENISRLAKEHLSTNFTSYKKSQIMKLGKNEENSITLNENNNNLSKEIKIKIAKKIKDKKAEIKNLQKLYSNPELIPGEVKTQIASKIQKKKSELENLYSSPKKTITLERAQRWAAIQIAKLFLGIPIVPGR
tara:strand:+ start:354 stop:1055 length:702 start_codon:yes stop_codon:yes gene_type:complete